LKLIDQLRKQSAVGGGVSGGRVLKEVVLEEPIRYSAGTVHIVCTVRRKKFFTHRWK